ncbi:sushi, von Willebrand factor type A, EGF and pentraxin domain-containing protein 1-like [Pecten maximus]|uniref:sushi, von Willebrand factor type A, EGF and pentraxin domain-containing protein 1-like n=1 Tax=Pecten maximus TaxID=6579 RepID=UPI0014588C6C|nr:sushi, von Willebrand factor type A, EGF and pentraxin domain-containing protein 1-like [Pecten maximus]
MNSKCFAKMAVGHYFLLAGFVFFSLVSDSSASFSDVIRFYKQSRRCLTEEIRQNGDIECHINGMPFRVGDFVQTGTVCDVTYSQTSQRVFCENNVWRNYGDLPVHTHDRHKRFWGFVAGAVIGWVACEIFCSRGGGVVQVVNKPPSISCQEVERVRYAPPRETSVVVTWPEPTATDPEQGKLTPKQKFGLPSGSHFEKGSYAIPYSVTDDHSNSDTCIISFTVNVTRCDKADNIPGHPVNGQMRCTPYQYDPILGTTCLFSCNEGYELTDFSSTSRTCKDNGYFDGQVAQCTKIQCDDLENPQNGEKYCSSQTYYNSVCGTTCSATGYESDGGFIHCQSDGLWTAPLPSCQDKRAPHFTFCPVSPVREYADKGKSSATVVWMAPTATDNSGDVTIIRTIGQDSGSEFGIGKHPISYVARDPSGKESVVPCSFDVVVEHLECDSPDGKFDDELILPDCPGTEYTYGTVCNVSCIRNYEIIGNTTITCEREGPNSTKMVWDWGGGEQPTCNDKCPAIQPPANGAFVCQTAGNEYCRLSCSVDFGYPSGTSKNQMFVCTDQQLWDPPEADDCAERRPPDANTIGADLHYFVGDCNDPNVQSGLKDKFLAYMIELVNNGWSNRCPNDTGCIRDTIKVICGPVTSRRRRETISLTTGRWRPAGLDRNVPFRVKRTTDNDYVITLKITLEISWEGGTSADDLQKNDQDISDIITAIDNEIASGGNALSFDGIVPAQLTADRWPMMECPFGQTAKYDGDIPNCEGCATGKYYESTISSCAKCPVGTFQNETYQTMCKACPSDMSTKESGRKNISECFPVCSMGSYSASGVIPCTKCPLGEYQPNANSKNCNKCDVGKTTIERGQTADLNCTPYDVVLNSPGNNMTFPPLTTTLESLTLMFWMKCPSGNVTRPSFGFVNGGTHTSMLDIVDAETLDFFRSTIQIESNGWTHVAIKWLGTTNQAELAINGNNVGAVPVTTGNVSVIGSYLLMTQNSGNNGSCRISGLQMTNSSKSDADLQTDIATCLPNGDDAFYNMDNFKDKIGIDIDTPSKCDEFDECTASPCGVHICENLLNGYRCYCKSGYTGDNCENAPDFCVNNQCEHAATCTSGAWNYTCACATGFKGKLCEEAIVNGNWADWGDYGQCSKSCNGGNQTRIRTCTNPSPGPDGADCLGSGQDQISCNTDPCPACEPVGHLLLRSRYTKTDFCVSEGDYTRCVIICETGMEFVEPPLDYYECGANTSYTWNRIPPSCASIRPGTRLTIDTSVTYPVALPCGTETDQALNSAAGEAQCVRNNACDVSISTTGCSSRRKRDTTTTADISFFINVEELQDFNLTALLEDNIVSADLQTYLNAITELEQTAQEINNSASDFFTVNVNNVTYNIDPSTLDFSAVITCPNGSIANDGACVQCPAGTSEENRWCVYCALGTYQNQEGQTECLACPTGYTTQFVGMIDVANCSVEEKTTASTTDSTTATSISASATTTTTSTTTTTTPTLTPTTRSTPSTSTTTPTPATTTTTTTSSVPTTTTTTATPTTTISTSSTTRTTTTANLNDAPGSPNTETTTTLGKKNGSGNDKKGILS